MVVGADTRNHRRNTRHVGRLITFIRVNGCCRLEASGCDVVSIQAVYPFFRCRVQGSV